MTRDVFFAGLAMSLFAAVGQAQESQRAKDPTLEQVLLTKIDFKARADDMANMLGQLESRVHHKVTGSVELFAIYILGEDLQARGITRNQRITDLALEGATVAEVLTAIVVRGNPNRTARMHNQQLVWTIGVNPSNKRKRAIVITTRDAVQKRGDRLPAVFLPMDEGANALKLPAGTAGGAAAARHAEWSKYVSADTLEDEVKRLSIKVNGSITAPTKFASRDYRDARLYFNELAALFAVISRYDKPVRFSKDAAGVSRLFSHSARSSQVGSVQAYNEAKLRKADLSALVRGDGVAVDDKLLQPIDDWAEICERSPLMQRMEQALTRTLKEGTTDAATFRESKTELIHEAEIISLVATVIQQEGQENAQDLEYQKHAKDLRAAVLEIVDASKAGDYDAAEAAVGRVGMTCSKCHADWR